MIDSFAFNPNRWMLVSSECSILFMKKRKHLTETLKVDPIYFKYKQYKEMEDLNYI